MGSPSSCIFVTGNNVRLFTYAFGLDCRRVNVYLQAILALFNLGDI